METESVPVVPVVRPAHHERNFNHLGPFKSFRQRAWYHEVEQTGGMVRRATLRQTDYFGRGSFLKTMAKSTLLILPEAIRIITFFSGLSDPES